MAPWLSSAGASDAFGSASFFAVNGARYVVLLAMLRANFDIFVLGAHPPNRPLRTHSRASANVNTPKLDFFPSRTRAKPSNIPLPS